MRRWTVGELAAETGVSVRALHHYDAVGLLVPDGRTESGYRLYGEPEVERLYRIRALQGLGLSLEEVGRVLDGLPLREVVARQVAQVDAQAAHLRRYAAGWRRSPTRPPSTT